jgi:hypothetical protein
MVPGHKESDLHSIEDPAGLAMVEGLRKTMRGGKATSISGNLTKHLETKLLTSVLYTVSSLSYECVR